MLACAVPAKCEHVGRSVRLAPLTSSHSLDLWRVAQDADESWTYLGYGPFGSFEEFVEHVSKLSNMADQPFFAVLPEGEKALGWVSYCDIEPHNGALEIGSIWFSPTLQRTKAATEALYLLLDHAFTEGFQRVAWRCNALNQQSRKAAARLGFVYEGTWRKAQIVKGHWRDTSWYSQLATEWASNKLLFDRWLEDANFDDAGRQLSRLR